MSSKWVNFRFHFSPFESSSTQVSFSHVVVIASAFLPLLWCCVYFYLWQFLCYWSLYSFIFTRCYLCTCVCNNSTLIVIMWNKRSINWYVCYLLMYFYVLLLLNPISYAIFGWHVSFFILMWILVITIVVTINRSETMYRTQRQRKRGRHSKHMSVFLFVT